MDEPTPLAADATTQAVLRASAQHDLAALKPLLRVAGRANVQDPTTGYTPLHAAIAACGPVGDEDDEEGPMMARARKVVEELFFSGAIWNDLDAGDETPGCLAYRLGRRALYGMCVDAGVRAELLLGLMGGYEELEGESEDGDVDGDGDEDEDEEGRGDGDGREDGREMPSPAEAQQDCDAHGAHEHGAVVGDEAVEPREGAVPAKQAHEEAQQQEAAADHKDVNSASYLASDLSFSASKLLDADSNGVMMSWETPIMQRTVDLLLPSRAPGARILNIGFGMGIIDGMFARTRPLTHHIVEAHPAVLAHLAAPGSAFSGAWQAAAPAGGSYAVHAGRWQDVCPALLRAGCVYDAIYFDTFAESYAQLRRFFTECVPGLLAPAGRLGWFHGLGADRRVCYDVYCKLVEMDLLAAGLDVEWSELEVGDVGRAGEGEGEWEGVRRRYWVLEKYRLPICRFLG